MKFKGILKERTFLRLLYHSGDFFNGDFEVITGKPEYLPNEGRVRYSTKKADFLITRRNVRYFEVWQLIGGR